MARPRTSSARRFLLRGLAAFVVGATLLPRARAPHWWVRVFDFPRVQILALGLGVFGAYATLAPRARRRATPPVDTGMLALLGATLAYQAWRIRPYTPLHAVQSAPASSRSASRSFRLVIANVLMTNRDAASLLATVRAARPDIVLLVEPDAWWVERAKPLASELPNVVEHPLGNTYGIALYSRFPLFDVEVRELVDDGVPSLRGSFELPSGDRVRFAFVHPRPPRVGQDTAERDAELVIVAREIGAAEGPALVAGDFNDVAWSSTTKLFQGLSGLLDPRVGRGLYATYHAKHFALRWPLDHVFHSRHFTLGELARLDAGGSDHFPILIELVLGAPGATAQAPPRADTDDHAAADAILEREAARKGSD